ncbi:alpha/beta fold hydrolase [Propionibacteriaceae bacterium G1746]
MTTLNYQQVGDGARPMVFLHGLFGQGKNFGIIAKALVERHPDLRCALVDLPNHGRSPWTDSIDYVDMAAQVAAFIGDWAGGRPVVLLGHSMGGRTAMQVALRHPELVERLVVADISPVQGDTSSSVFADLIRGLRHLDLGTLSSRAQADEVVAPYIPNTTIRNFLLTNLRRTEDGWAWLCNLDLIERDLDAVADWPEPGPGAQFTGPVLWIGGNLSNYIRPEYAPVMKGYFPSTQLVRIKDAGHWVHSQQPRVFTSLVHEFLQQP